MRAKPTPRDFDLSDEDIERIGRIQAVASDNEAGCSWLDNLLPKEKGLFSGLISIVIVCVLGPFFFLGLIVTPIIQFFASIRLSLDHKSKNFDAYRLALHEFEKAKADYWFALSGLDFEIQLAALFRKAGYAATVTSASGDKGIDIILEKNSERLIVQCKQHAKPVGPATARELYGALMASNATRAILASTSGFTPGVHSFTYDKPIQLMAVHDIVALQEKILTEQVETRQPPLAALSSTSRVS